MATVESSDSVRTYCREWLAACTTGAGSLRDRQIARDTDRWRRLVRMQPGVPNGACPEDINTADWHILHLLQHVAWMWPATPWGQTNWQNLGALYHAHPAVQRLCEHVVADEAWGDIITIPSGLTWEDRLISMENGLTAQAQN
ncbi:hypothetical protein PR003_g32704 [Phytophthora rubi]|uniref:Uncharacterized protein n=1 Tax=Phytophthora rubi TaxID=129364 RepID=A0A6A4B1B4_9STRA|nr:hypothetical protein PR003_g32704 [Phytophthora rubi]